MDDQPMSTFWSLWVCAIVVINVVGALWLLFANRKVTVTKPLAEGEVPTTGHVYDGIEEYDNPLPGWWFNMFVLTVIFAVIYLILYPGMGNFTGVLGWSSSQQWQEQIDEADKTYGPLFAQYENTPIETLSVNPEALKMGGRLFANNCAICHGSDGRGTYGFPNLADNDWLYGGSANAIKTSITSGRKGMMNSWGGILSEAKIEAVSQYVFSLGNRKHNDSVAAEGGKVFATYCVACHGADAKGNVMMGAPNLTDNTWLYGGSPEYVKHSIRNGRNGQMPAQESLLSGAKIHLLSAYVYSLSQNQTQPHSEPNSTTTSH